MKRKLLFILCAVAALVCLFAITVSAKAVYKDTDGQVLLELEFYVASDKTSLSTELRTEETGVLNNYTDRFVVKSYTEYNGGLAKFDGEGNALTWYLVSSTTYSSGNIEHTVASFKTLGEDESVAVRGSLSGDKFSYVGVNSKNIVSACFPDNAGINSFGFSYGGYGSYGSNNLLFFYGPNTVTGINEDFFQETPVIVAELDEEAPITSFGKKICHEARNLRAFTIPSSVTTLKGDSPNQGATFYNCISLTEVVFGENSVLTKIGNSEFHNCYKLARITLPQTLTSMGGAVFGNCRSLAYMVIPDGMTSLAKDTFTNTPFKNSPFTENSKLTSIDSYAFYNTAIEEIIIPRGLTTWPVLSGERCPNLKKVTVLPNSAVTTIPDNAFYNLTSLTDIQIPDSVVSVGSKAFSGSGIINSPFSENSRCTSIGVGCFEYCESLKNINIPKGISVLPAKSFFDCKSLLRVNFNSGCAITEIGSQAFEGCKALVSIDLPDTVTTLTGRTFLGCTALTSVTIPNSLTTMGVRIFQGCSSLKTVNFGANLSTIISESDHFSLTYQAGVQEVYLPATFTADSIPTTGKITYIFTGANTKFYYAGTQEQFDGIVARLKGVEGNAAFNTVPTVENGRLILVNACDAFYDGNHKKTETVAYENGFDCKGTYTSYCSQCKESVSEELDAIVSALGYSYGIYNEERTMISSGFEVDTALVALYERVNGTVLETGIMFTTPSVVAEAAPNSLVGITYLTDNGETFGLYEYKITFPGKENEKYEDYAAFEFVVSAFIKENESYSFIQGNGEGETVSVLQSGFTTTNLNKIISAVAEKQ